MSMTQLVVGSPVDGRDGKVGTVAGTRAATARPSPGYVLVRLTRLFGLAHSTRLVPAAWVQPGLRDSQRVTLDASRAEVAGCPPWRPDDDIRADVVEALATAGGFFEAATVHATVHEGIVDLTGHTRHRTAARQAVATAQAVRGVVAVQDHSMEDGALAVAVAQALTHDPDTRRACLRVASRLGAIELDGALPSESAKQRATTLAQAVPGVTGVHNGATVPSMSAGQIDGALAR
jgi:osmotically-inducible protein OsmY